MPDSDPRKEVGVTSFSLTGAPELFAPRSRLLCEFQQLGSTMKKLLLLFTLLQFAVAACSTAAPQRGSETVQATPKLPAGPIESATPCETATAIDSTTAGSTPPGTVVTETTGTGNVTGGTSVSGTGVGSGTISPEQAATQQALFEKANPPGPSVGTPVTVESGGQSSGVGALPPASPEMNETPHLSPNPGPEGRPVLPNNPGPEATPVLPSNPGPEASPVLPSNPGPGSSPTSKPC